MIFVNGAWTCVENCGGGGESGGKGRGGCRKFLSFILPFIAVAAVVVAAPLIGAVAGAIGGAIGGAVGGVVGAVAGSVIGSAVGAATTAIAVAAASAAGAAVVATVTSNLVQGAPVFRGVGTNAAFAAITAGAFKAVSVIGNGIQQAFSQQLSVPRIISSPTVKQAFETAWSDSNAYDPLLRHEEGGWIVKKLFGQLDVMRWPSGDTASLGVPSSIPDNVVGYFHTHPNYGTGGGGIKGPSWFVDSITGSEYGDVPLARVYKAPAFIVDKESYIYYDGTGNWTEVYRR